MDKWCRLGRWAGLAAVSANLLTALIGAARPAAAAAPLGGGENPWIQVQAVDPHAPETLYAEAGRRLQGVGAFADLVKSEDGGITWKRASRGLAAGRAPGLALVADPDRAGVLFAADRDGRIYRSDNGGGRWLKVAATREPRPRLFLVPGRRPVLFLAGDGRRLWRSADAGVTWEKVFESSLGVGTVIADPADPRRLYLNSASSLSGVLTSADGGDSWQPLLPTVAVGRLTVLAVTATRPSTIWAGGPSGLYRSRDGGATFAGTSLTGRFGGAPFGFDPASPTTLYAAAEDSPGVQVSTDGGASWIARSAGLAGPVTGLWVDRQTHAVFAQAGQLVYRAEAGAALWSPGSLRGIPSSPR